jgi:hypothetical protein
MLSGTTDPTQATLNVRAGVPNSAVVMNVRNSAGTSLLYVSGSGAVGIGTNAPAYRLDVPTGDASFYGVRVGRGNASIGGNVAVGSGVILASVSTGLDLTAVGDSALAYDSTGDDNTAVGFGALFLNSTGDNNTAVGSLALFTNDTSANSTAVGYAALGNATGARNTALGSEAGYGTTTGNDNIFIGRQAGLSVTTGGSNTIIGSVAGSTTLSNTIILAAGTTERIRVDASGNVGIGTSEMSDKLAVNGSMSVTGSLLPGTDNLYNLGSATKRWNTIYAANISGSLTGSNLTAGQVVVAGVGGVLSGSNNLWWDNSLTRVGIGTNSPAYDLDIFKVGGTLRVGGTGGGAALYFVNTSNYINYNGNELGHYTNQLLGFRFYNNSILTMNLSNSNKVSIGGTNAVSKFEVTGSGTTSATSTMHLLNSSNSSLLFVRDDGNVGVGTSSFTGRLYISGSSTTTTPTMVVREGVVSPTGGVGTFDAQNSAGTSLFFVSGSGFVGVGTNTQTSAVGSSFIVSSSLAGNAAASFSVGTQVFGTSVNISKAFTHLFQGVAGSSGEYMRITNAGNVGIGTNTATSRLFVSGSSTATTPTMTVKEGVASPTAGAGTFDVQNSAGTSLLFVSGSGNVGIGTITPNERFSVHNGNQDRVGFGISSAVSTLYLGSKTNTEAYRTLEFDRTAGNLYFKYGTVGTPLSTAATIDSSGNVGIGTTSPGFKLEVNGTFAATTKSFVIPHPTRIGWKLRYGSLEGPENGVYVRGECNSDVIELPDYWQLLVDESSITVQLTPVGKYQTLFIESIENNSVKIGRGWLMRLLGIKPHFHYTVTASRKDVKFETEYVA